MGARVCRLCGKSLGRMHLGSDEFCSREHQNQFRLRQGMGQLMEASKVASLMRRRENPKPIQSASAPPDPAEARREFLYARSRAVLDAGISLPPPGAGPCRETAASCPPVWWRGARPSPLGSRAADTTARFFARGGVVPPAPAGVPAAASFPRARVSVRRFPRPPAPGKLRQFGLLRRSGFRISMAGRVFQFRPADGPGAKYGGPRAAARQLPATAREGRALRVSASAGFRLPALRQGVSNLVPVMGAGPNALAQRSTVPVPPAPGAIGLRPAPRVQRVAPRISDVPCPTAPPAHLSSSFSWPGTLALSTHGPRDSAASPARSKGPRWSKPDGCVLPRPGGTPAPSLFPPAAILAVRPPRTRALAGDRRPAISPFVPQEAKLGMPVLTIQGAAIGVPASKPRARAADAKTVVEEHFAGGWTEWTGGVDDWKLDAAGVRTGSLALFRPSLDLADYDLEFLARIENRSVSWVFRAEGFDRYQLATIALAPDGGYELTRCTVLEGTAGPPASLRVARPGRARQALTVRTRASGGDFTISIDGKRVDHWTDSRLAAGGVGFVGTPEDRARLYWIRLSYGGPVRSQA